jgi:hypothetical protein
MKKELYIWDMNNTQTHNTMNHSLTPAQLADIQATKTTDLMGLCANAPSDLPIVKAAHAEIMKRLFKK